MPIKTNLSSSPYFDDYAQAKDFSKILFQPSVAVQVRELNQLQTMMQKQFERVGDNLYKRGTVLDGVNFLFYNKYDYVKLLDNTLNDGPANPSSYVGLFVRNSANLSAYVMNSQEGFETADPKLKTIFVNYRNSGDSFTSNSFLATEILTVHSEDNRIFGIDIINGGISFSNSDLVVIVPVVSVNVSTGTFIPGDFLYAPSTGANVEITAVTADPDSGNIILDIKPLGTDMTNSSVNSVAWTFSSGDAVQNDGATVTGTLDFVYGNGATSLLRTSGTGRVEDLTVTNGGTGYKFVPHATVQSDGNVTGLTALDLTAKNFLTQLTVSSVTNPVGNGYAFGVTEGVIYQKGYYLRVNSQVIVVNSYSSSPNNVVVGFDTEEEIITADIDTSLLDNALGTENHTAPGANRLKLVPTLVTKSITDARANDAFFILVEWNDGNPYKQHTTTAFDNVGDEMARRLFDVSGDFVTDTFLVTTDAIANTQLEGDLFTVVVDPGTAYVGGFKTNTLRNFRVDVKKGLDTHLAVNQRVSMNYDNYIRINEVGGLFQFSTGDLVDFYDTATDFLTDTTKLLSGVITPTGTKIGEARIRSMILESGIAGDAAAVYRLYLFDLTMSFGKNFRDVRGVHYPGTNEGIADTVLVLDPTTATNIAKIIAPENNGLVFKSGADSIKNSNNSNYIYRTIDQTEETANTGLLVKTIAAAPTEFYPYGFGVALSNSQMQELYVVPIGNDLIQFSPLSGTVSVNTTISNVVGTTTTFIADFDAGDYCYVDDTASNNDIRKVNEVVNNTFLVVDSPFSFTDATSEIRRAFPKFAPVPFGNRSGLSANLDVTGDILTLNYGMTFAGAVTVNTALGVNIERFNVTSTAKTASRNQFVKIRTANNVGGTAGPWCLGVPDTFRLRAVYIKTASDVDVTDPEVTREFYIEHNQNEDYYDLSYLYIRPRSALTLTSSDYLLVEFDYTTSSGAGYYDTVSYLGTANTAQISTIDATPLANLTSEVASFEIPELHTANGEFFDLINTIDFRPYVSNTVTTSATAGSAPLNPDIAKSFGNTADPANDKKFPLPDSLFASDIEEYKGRVDLVLLGPDGFISVLKGNPSTDPRLRVEPNLPQDAMKLQSIVVPPYPNIAYNLNDQLSELISTRMVNEIVMTERLDNHVLLPVLDSHLAEIGGQPLGYTMSDIGALERRIEHLEYYTSLSILETSITNRVIPSSVDGTLNRFKFGFFADDYSTWIQLDRRDPQFAADIEVFGDFILIGDELPKLATNLLVPPKFPWVVRHIIPQVVPPWINFEIVCQPVASERPPECDLELVEIATGTNITANSILYSITILGGRKYYHHLNQVVDIDHVRMGTISGDCTLYYHAFYDPKVSVYQGQSNNLVIDTASAQALTTADVLLINKNPYTERFFYAARKNSWFVNTNFGKFWQNANGYVDFSGKLLFNHDVSGGRDYYIKTEVLKNQGIPTKYQSVFQYMLIYPTDVGFQEIVVFDPCLQTTPTVFNGTMDTNDIVPVSGNYDYIDVACFGLKPITKHNFFVDGVQNISNVKQNGGSLGGDLVSNLDGQLFFKYYLDDAWFNKVDRVNISAQPYLTQSAWKSSMGSQVRSGFKKDVAINGSSPNPYDEIDVDVAYALLEIKAVGSSAYGLVSLLSANKLF